MKRGVKAGQTEGERCIVYSIEDKLILVYEAMGGKELKVKKDGEKDAENYVRAALYSMRNVPCKNFAN